MAKKILSNKHFLFFCFLAVGLALGTFWDFEITQALYAPTNTFAILMEAFGWYPTFLPPILLAILWLTSPKEAKIAIWQRVLCGAGAILALALLYYVSYGYLVKRDLIAGNLDPVAILWAATAIAASAIFAVGISRFSPATKKKLVFFGGVGTVYLLFAQLVSYTFKFIWARPRFDEMLLNNSTDIFRPWYLPFGPGGSSFPSGHTANAAGVLMLLVLCDLFPNWQSRKKLVFAVCFGFVATMAFARIVIGRHFLSDTVAAFALMWLVFCAIKGSPQYKTALLNQIKTHAANPKEAPK